MVRRFKPALAAGFGPALLLAATDAAFMARPTTKAGVIWLDSPLDPVESGWADR